MVINKSTRVCSDAGLSQPFAENLDIPLNKVFLLIR